MAKLYYGDARKRIERAGLEAQDADRPGTNLRVIGPAATVKLTRDAGGFFDEDAVNAAINRANGHG